MEEHHLNAAKDDIIREVKEINRAWSTRDFSSLKKYFDENMVIAGPDLQKLGEGIDVCVKSYQDFCSRAKIFDFKETGIDVDAWDCTAVARVSYEIDYEIQGKRFEEEGREVLVFSKKSGEWLLI